MASIRAWEEEEDTHPPSPKKSDSSWLYYNGDQ
jgi:hypothetical protein